MDECEIVRLNIGSGVGEREMNGWRSIDRKLGSEAYPLPVDIADNSVHEIRAVHVLEHFGHSEIQPVLAHWVSKLKPGGRLAIAVPDFRWIAENYLAGKPIEVQGYVMGGQIDEDDWHHAIFDKEALIELLSLVGLERITEWQSDNADCTRLECSLNLQGIKPSHEVLEVNGVCGVLAAPRYGPTCHFQCAQRAFGALGIRSIVTQGCFWSQILSEGMEAIIADKSMRYVLTMDYDTIFTARDILELYRLLEANTSADAVCALQSKRGAEHALFGVDRDADGKPTRPWYRADFARSVTRIETGHFGLTLLRADPLRTLPRPWMCAKPNDEGRWTPGSGKIDPDIDFWHNWKKAGNTLYLANRVIVGHLEEVVTWPDKLFKPVHQSMNDYHEKGIPAEVLR